MPTRQPHRHTRQRAALLGVLSDARGPLTAEEILVRAGGSRILSRRTVFRQLGELVEEGHLVKLEFPGQPPRYEPPAGRHHPHLICRGCGLVFDLPGETPDIIPLITLPPGFTASGEEIILYGSCPDCHRRSLSQARDHSAQVT